ncbi:MAG TPA: hypothetical protein VE174_04665 [Actinomycetota bacterium]|nr:hypothetical protein [Actinomycetota bacterium]
MDTTTRSAGPQIRELFIEELANIQGGSAAASSDGGNTTMACCEEGPFGCCETPISLDDIIDPRP